MSRRRGAGGIERILEKLEGNVKAGNYYDAFQMYKSVYNRKIGESNPGEGLRLLVAGCQLFLSHKQMENGTELALLLGDHLVTHRTDPATALNEQLVSILRGLWPSESAKQRFLPKLFKWSKYFTEHGDPLLHKACAEISLLESDYVTCCVHCQYLDLDGVDFYCHTLLDVAQTRVYKSEAELVITSAVLQYLSIKRTEHARRIFKLFVGRHHSFSTDFPHEQPLLNFAELLLRAIDKGSAPLVKALRAHYTRALERDPTLNELIDKVLRVYFNETKQPAALGGLGGLMQSLFAPPKEETAASSVTEDADLD